MLRPGDKRLGWLLLLLVSVAWPTAQWHEATTRHEVCAEHGEVLDRPLASAERTQEEGVPVYSEESDAEAHEACPYLPLFQPTVSESAARLVWALVDAVLPVACTGRAAPERPIAILFLAPKQSPPSAA
jgi:hypothetical protein